MLMLLSYEPLTRDQLLPTGGLRRALRAYDAYPEHAVIAQSLSCLVVSLAVLQDATSAVVGSGAVARLQVIAKRYPHIRTSIQHAFVSAGVKPVSDGEVVTVWSLPGPGLPPVVPTPATGASFMGSTGSGSGSGHDDAGGSMGGARLGPVAPAAVASLSKL